MVFGNICLDSENLATVIRSLADTYVFTPTYDNQAMRHPAYRQYVMWQHGHLGKGNVTSRAERVDAHAIHHGQWYSSELITTRSQTRSPLKN